MQYGWILKALAKVKEAGLKRLYTVVFQDVIEKAKLWEWQTDQRLPRTGGEEGSCQQRSCCMGNFFLGYQTVLYNTGVVERWFVTFVKIHRTFTGGRFLKNQPRSWGRQKSKYEMKIDTSQCNRYLSVAWKKELSSGQGEGMVFRRGTIRPKKERTIHEHCSRGGKFVSHSGSG